MQWWSRVQLQCWLLYYTPCMETKTTISLWWTKQFWGYSIDFVSQVNHLKVWSVVIHWEVWDVDDDVKVRAGVYVPDGWWSLPWSSWLLLLRFIYFYFVFMTANNYTGVCHMVIAGVATIFSSPALLRGLSQFLTTTHTQNNGNKPFIPHSLKILPWIFINCHCLKF